MRYLLVAAAYGTAVAAVAEYIHLMFLRRCYWDQNSQMRMCECLMLMVSVAVCGAAIVCVCACACVGSECFRCCVLQLLHMYAIAASTT